MHDTKLYNCPVQVRAPWVKAVYGAVQHELLMGILLENLYEPGRIGPPARAPLPVGEPLPAPSKQAGALGVDRSQAPRWQVAVNVPVIQVAVESLPAPASAPDRGPPLAEVPFTLFLAVTNPTMHLMRADMRLYAVLHLTASL